MRLAPAARSAASLPAGWRTGGGALQGFGRQPRWIILARDSWALGGRAIPAFFERQSRVFGIILNNLRALQKQLHVAIDFARKPPQVLVLIDGATRDCSEATEMHRNAAAFVKIDRLQLDIA
jgi:hypothetical protein